MSCRDNKMEKKETQGFKGRVMGLLLALAFVEFHPLNKSFLQPVPQLAPLYNGSKKPGCSELGLSTDDIIELSGTVMCIRLEQSVPSLCPEAYSRFFLCHSVCLVIIKGWGGEQSIPFLP